jgi:hypothetical protein
MSKIKTQLFAKSNAVLTNDENKVIAIISCGKSEDITKKVKLAIKEDYIAEKVEIIARRETLVSINPSAPVNENPYEFSTIITDEDGDINTHDFTLTICATYK